jgi:hypothetical protein
MVRAKFKVTSLKRVVSSVPVVTADGKTEWHEGEVVSIEASPVYGNNDPNHENTKFWTATPSGRLELGTVNAAAAAEFVLGAEYYVDFTRA